MQVRDGPTVRSSLQFILVQILRGHMPTSKVELALPQGLTLLFVVLPVVQEATQRRHTSAWAHEEQRRGQICRRMEGRGAHKAEQVAIQASLLQVRRTHS